MEKWNPHYIDKTEYLEKLLERVPCVYIEGAAASGKSVLVNTILDKNTYEEYAVFFMDDEMQNVTEFLQKLNEVKESLQNVSCCCVFENFNMANFHENVSEFTMQKILLKIKELANTMLITSNILFVSRQRPQKELLDLLWKRQMDIFPQEGLLLSRTEIQLMAEWYQSPLDPDQVWKITGGWAGCVDLMFRMSVKNAGMGIQNLSVKEFRNSYEVDTYIRNEILATLSADERKLMHGAEVCPWLNEELCHEVWNLEDVQDMLKDLAHRGLLTFDRKEHRWKTAPLFCGYVYNENDNREAFDQNIWNRLGNWYNAHHYIREALYCLDKAGNEEGCCACMTENFSEIPFMDIDYSCVMKWNNNVPQISYLRGMYCYSIQNLEGLQEEIQNLQNKDPEIYLNLLYMDPEVSTEEWLETLQKMCNQNPIRLYQVMGGSFSCLCGLRDLTALFSCQKKEENRKGRIWNECLGEKEWKYYRLAKIQYYLETDRVASVSPADQDFMRILTEDADWQLRLAAYYLLGKLQRINGDTEKERLLERLEKNLSAENDDLCVRNIQAITLLYSHEVERTKRLMLWLRGVSEEGNTEINEKNYAEFYCMSRGFILLNQPEKAEKVLNRLIPWLKIYRRRRLMAELLFQQAIIYWNKGVKSQALRSVIESFLVTGESRYVGFYTEYGRPGKEVLEYYVEWLQNSEPERWNRKKKYLYGNVIRMPMEEYLEVILRCARREARYAPKSSQQYPEEKLTMTEIVVLQYISRGLTNSEICQEMNLKLPTVKSHIYSIYKKLEVSTRVQAILKGKEIGVLK